MEGLLTNYYEYHFLYINGIHHVESRNIQGMALMKLFFHPGTNMAQAMAETIGYVNRSRAFMPPGTVSPFIIRFDTGSVPVGYLVLSSETKSIGEIQDQALFKVRPMFASLPGVSAPPPFGGSQRTVVVRLDPDRLRAYRMSPDEVIAALTAGQRDQPVGQRPDRQDDADRADQRDGPAGPGAGDDPDPARRRSRPSTSATWRPSRTPPTSRPATRWSTAAAPSTSSSPSGPTPRRSRSSTTSRRPCPSMQAVLPDDIKVSFEFDQSPTSPTPSGAWRPKALLGAVLTGLMVLLFLRDWRSVIVVVLNIPFALCGAIVALWLTGQTINLMTLGGLALAVGILVDEATVEVENIHHQMEGTSLGRPRRPAGQPADGRAAAAGDALRAGGVPAVVLHAGGGAGAVRAAVAGGRLRDDRVVPAVEHVRAGAVGLAAAAPSPPAGRRANTGARCSIGPATPTAGPSAPPSACRWLIVPAISPARRR